MKTAYDVMKEALDLCGLSYSEEDYSIRNDPNYQKSLLVMRDWNYGKLNPEHVEYAFKDDGSFYKVIVFAGNNHEPI
jgi:hypothetical protein